MDLLARGLTFGPSPRYVTVGEFTYREIGLFYLYIMLYSTIPNNDTGIETRPGAALHG